VHPRWKRLAVVLACCGILAFFLARGDEPEAPPEGDEPGLAPIEIRLPPLPEPEPPHEQARGLYVLDAEDMRVSLELMRDRRFRFLSTRQGVVREGVGTWSLTGNRLTLAYTHVDGKSVGEKPLVAVNVWGGGVIELKDTGLPGRVILTKRNMIRQR
jgi:hypothetical protein